MKMKLAAVLFSACLLGAAVGVSTAFADDVEPEPAEVAVEAAEVAEDAAVEVAAVEEKAAVVEEPVAEAPAEVAAEPVAEEAAAPEAEVVAEDLDDAVLPEEEAEPEDIVEPEDAEIPEDVEIPEDAEDAEIPDEEAIVDEPISEVPTDGGYGDAEVEEITVDEIFEEIVKERDLSVKDGYAYKVIDDEAYIVFAEPSEKEEVSLAIPTTLDKYPVVGVGGMGLVSLEPEKVTSVTLPEGVKYVFSGAFAYTEITSIDLPDSLEMVDYFAFGECAKLEKVFIPQTLKLAPYIPYNEFTHEFKPGYIDVDAFEGCVKLDEVYYGGSEDQWNDMMDEFKETFIKDCLDPELSEDEAEAIWKDYQTDKPILTATKRHFNATHAEFNGTVVANPITGDDQPTGDNSALGAVLAIAVLAGTAVVLTKKREHLA